MKLVQKLPIGLGLACMMLLSSCSKEDVQTPQPQAGGVNEHSGAKTNAGEDQVLPVFPATDVRFEVNYNSFPRYWEKVTEAMNAPVISAGSSSLTSLWGHQSGWSVAIDPHWVKPLPPVPGNPDSNSMVTVMSYAHTSAETSSKSSVFTTLSNLKPEKTYAITFYVASTTVTTLLGNGTKSVCATSAEIKMLNVDNGNTTTKVNFAGKEAEWVKKTIIFTAKANTAKFIFSGLTPLGNVYSYIHLFVDTNSIKELNAFEPMVTL